ncbi:hypothetical protein N9441_02905 [Candidatus Pelagibacter sp.]|nr:hypothetical protein [Candidatus Pelagibacter sp.]
MKKFLGIVIIGFLLGGNVFADTKIIDTFRYKPSKMVLFSVHTLCIDGYKFITTHDYDSDYVSGRWIDDESVSVSVTTSVNTIQFMISENGKMLPAKCN